VPSAFFLMVRGGEGGVAWAWEDGRDLRGFVANFGGFDDRRRRLRGGSGAPAGPVPPVLRNEPSQRLLCLGYADFGIDPGHAWGVEELVCAFDRTFVAGEVAHDEAHGIEVADGCAAVSTPVMEFFLAALESEEGLLQLVAAELGADVPLHHALDEFVFFRGVGMVGGGHGLLDFFDWVGVVRFLREQESGESMLERVTGAFEFAGSGARARGVAGVAAVRFELEEADHAWVR